MKLSDNTLDTSKNYDTFVADSDGSTKCMNITQEGDQDSTIQKYCWCDSTIFYDVSIYCPTSVNIFPESQLNTKASGFPAFQTFLGADASTTPSNRYTFPNFIAAIPKC